MKRLLCYAHFDANGELRPFVKHALQTMSALCAEMIFVSNSPLADADQLELSSLCSHVLVNNNTGYDFYMWKLGMESVDLSDYDEIILMNSSVYGPLFNMEEVFSRMDGLDCDFWGITECFQMQPHIQSYFLVFRKKTISSASFQNFWNGILPYQNKLQVIQSYEVGLTQWLVESGFKPGVLCPLEQLGSYCRETGRRVRKKDNASVKHAGELLHIGNPFLKRDAVRNGKVDMAAVRPFLQRYGYPEDLVNEQTPPRTLECPLCGHPGKLKYKGVRDFLNLHDNNRYDYCRCSSKACGVLWLASDYEKQPDGAVAPASIIKTKSATYLPSSLKKSSPGKILEIGCGQGERLEKLRELGWQVTGLANDAESFSRLKKLNIAAINRFPQDISAERLFDSILVTQGLEQANDPQFFLSQCHHMLNPGGKLLLYTPNANSLLLRIFRSYWFGLNVPRSKLIHNKASLKSALLNAGFDRVKITSSSLFASEYGNRSIEIVMNKWTSPATYKTIKKFLPMGLMGTALLSNLIVRMCGEVCVVSATKNKSR